MMKPLKRLVRAVGARLAEKPYVTSHYGPRIIRRTGDRTFNSCWSGKYGSFTSSIIAGMAEPFVLFDIGANLGIYSLIGAANPHCRRVFAFEPVPATFRYLVGNIELNDAGKVVPICGAITSDTGQSILPMSFEPQHSGVSHIVETGSDNAVYTIALHAEHLDALEATSSGCRIMAKIDVEGAEMFVLQALRQSRMFDRITDIVIEVSSSYHDDDERDRLLGFLTEQGFSEARRGQQPGWTLYDALYTRTVAGTPDVSAARS